MLKKVIVIGCPGAGKSFFSKQLHQKTNIPVYYLDKIYWKKDWKHIPFDEFRAKIKKILAKKSYIIDGNYQDFLEDRFKEAETIFFLDISEKECLKSVHERKNSKRDDFPEFLDEEVDMEFQNFILNFKNNGRLKILELHEKYPDKEFITFKSRKEAELFIKKQV